MVLPPPEAPNIVEAHDTDDVAKESTVDETEPGTLDAQDAPGPASPHVPAKETPWLDWLSGSLWN